VDDYAFTKDSQNMSRCDHDALCILLLRHIARHFAEGMPPYTTHQLARHTELPHTLVQGLLDELVTVGLLSEANDETGTKRHYLPRQDIHRISINKIIRHLDNNGVGRVAPRWAQGNTEWNLIRQLRATLNAKDGETTIADL
jgi:DNA-binding IscR family transcriptional regulator